MTCSRWFQAGGHHPGSHLELLVLYFWSCRRDMTYVTFSVYFITLEVGRAELRSASVQGSRRDHCSDEPAELNCPAWGNRWTE
jgi:hypothetical protein